MAEVVVSKWKVVLDDVAKLKEGKCKGRGLILWCCWSNTWVKFQLKSQDQGRGTSSEEKGC
jgi:hypothetical protein